VNNPRDEGKIIRMKNVLLFLLLLLAALAAGSRVMVGAQGDEAHWPQWRGPSFNGMARGGAPVEWSTTKNVKWKTRIAGRGHSTPVVWGNRIFLTTAVPVAPSTPTPPPASESDAARSGGGAGAARGGPGGGGGVGQDQRLVVMALDRRSGKVLWEKTAKVVTPHEGYHRTYGSFASNSPVTDGKYVYASFGSNGVYCYDLDGKLIWERDLGVRMKMRLEFGEGTAPTLAGDRLILTFDSEKDSFVVTLDKLTGKELWRARRDEMSSWSTPLVIDFKGRKHAVVSATRKVRSYDLESGSLLWECAGLGANVIPAPVFQKDTIFVMSGFRDPKLMAIRLGKEGDLSGTESILWTQTRGLSYTPSPVLFDNKYYALTDNGLLSCFDATTGEPYYHQTRLPQADSFKASPIGADGRLYIASENGVVTVVKMGEKFEVIATNIMDDQMFIASPVVAAGDLLLRSQDQLFCISQSPLK
jgi:outer membrane protein assembly factor BamB